MKGQSSGPLLPLLRSTLRRQIMARKFRFEPAERQKGRTLLVDVSTIVKSDARTGIQRVVRALLGQLANSALPELSIEPVFASRDHGYCKAILTSDGRLVPAGSRPGTLQQVEVKPGDIFLGLDLAAHVLPAVEADLASWRRKGVTISVMVYDLLPLTHPQWFSSKLVKSFRRWLGVLARQVDRCICISNSVANDLAMEMAGFGHGPNPEIVTIPLGSDLGASYPSRGMPENIEELRGWMHRHRTVLSVGTVEPRKGHDQVLKAMEHVWQSDASRDLAWLVIGRPGWKTKDLQVRLRNHPEQGKRLLWLESASDEMLSEAYVNAAGLIAASKQEGFGLPLLEALCHQVPVIARDLPVFREIGGSLFDYFDDDRSEFLADRIELWLSQPNRPNPNIISSLPKWSDSATSLLRHLGILVTPEISR